MSVIRRLNALGQMRVDVPDIRSIESSICNDFDVLAGDIWAGQQPLIVKGFTVDTDGTVGLPASSLRLNIANSGLIHYGASESGSIFLAPSTAPVEVLSSTAVNSKVIGSFTASATNYVGLDYRRSKDNSTSDLTKFSDASGGLEFSQIVPKAWILDYKIIISTQAFSTSSNIAPLAIVVTNSNNDVVSVADARKLLFRLGSGGELPGPNSGYTWTDTSRYENYYQYDGSTYTSSPFLNGDKNVSSMKQWMDAVMHRVWELGGGHYWYSRQYRDNVRICYDPADVLGTVNDNWDWVLTGPPADKLFWKGLSVAFENSRTTTGTLVYFNEIADSSTIDAAGVTFLDGYGLYVDIQRSTSGATITPFAAPRATVYSVTETLPGSRYLLAWRKGNHVYVRDRAYEIGRNWTVATKVTSVALPAADGILGAVKLSATPFNASHPTVVPIMADGKIEVTAFANNSHAIKGTGHGEGAGGWFVSGGTSSSLSTAIYAQGGGALGSGIWANGPSNAAEAGSYTVTALVTDLGPATAILAYGGTGTKGGDGGFFVGGGDGSVKRYGIVAVGSNPHVLGPNTATCNGGDGLHGYGGPSTDGFGAVLSEGGYGYVGIGATTTSGGSGVYGVGGAGSVAGAPGVYGLGGVGGGAVGAPGVYGLGAAEGGVGVWGAGSGSAIGVAGKGGTFIGGNSSANHGGDGAQCTGGNSSGGGGYGGHGVVGNGGTKNGGGIDGYGGYFTAGGATSGGVYGTGGLYAVYGFDGSTAGVCGESSSNKIGVRGASHSSTGVEGTSVHGIGVVGSSDESYGGQFTGNATRAPLRLVPQSAEPTGQAGDIYYDSDTNKLYFYNGSAWKEISYVP